MKNFNILYCTLRECDVDGEFMVRVHADKWSGVLMADKRKVLILGGSSDIGIEVNKYFVKKRLEYYSAL